MIGIICAMDKELKSFISSLENLKEIDVMNFKFYQGNINKHQIVLVKSGIGKVSSGLVTLLMIEHFKPRLIINSGIAGGYHKTLKPLDIVIGNKIGCYDIDMMLDGALFGSISGEKRFIENDIKIEECNNLTIKYGTLMSADQFQGNRDYLDNVFSKYFEDELVMGVDMESYSIASICDKYDIKWCVVRAISDIIGCDSQIDSYNEFAEKAAHNAYTIIMKNFLG